MFDTLMYKIEAFYVRVLRVLCVWFPHPYARFDAPLLPRFPLRTTVVRQTVLSNGGGGTPKSGPQGVRFVLRCFFCVSFWVFF